MAKRRAARRTTSTGSARKRTVARRSGKRPTKKTPATKASARKKAPARTKRANTRAPRKTPRLDRARKTLEETVPTPPSSLNMNRRGSAVRTGRAELAESRLAHKGMSPGFVAGAVGVNLEDASFTGEEAPGGDNPTT